MNTNFPAWEPDIPILKALYPSGGLPACRAALPHRTDLAIYTKARELGLKVDMKAKMAANKRKRRPQPSRALVGPPKPTPERLKAHEEWKKRISQVDAFARPSIQRVIPAGQWQAEVPGPRTVFELAEAL